MNKYSDHFGRFVNVLNIQFDIHNLDLESYNQNEKKLQNICIKLLNNERMKFNIELLFGISSNHR